MGGEQYSPVGPLRVGFCLSQSGKIGQERTFEDRLDVSNAATGYAPGCRMTLRPEVVTYMRLMRQTLLLLMMLVSAGARGEYKEPAYPANFSITFKRSACFGTCPVYRVTVDAHGLVTFEPEEFTKIEMPQTLQLPPHKLWQLAGALEDAWFFERQAAYEPGTPGCSVKRFTSDSPGFEIAASIDKRKNQVRVNEGCAEVDHTFMSLPAALERILGIEKFIYGSKP